MKIYSLDEAQDLLVGKIGTPRRDQFEFELKLELIGDMIKTARKERHLTQEQLADKAGTKKSYISKLENGKGNIQLSTLIRIFEQGLNRKIGLTFL